MPQLVPSVSRVQAWVSVVVTIVHEPPLHRGVITCRERDADSSHVPE